MKKRGRMIFDCYKVNLQHRGKLPKAQKSQWVVDEWEELRLFALAQLHGWRCAKQSSFWSIKAEHASPLCKIGEDKDGDLYLAKYVSDKQNQWHGYPVAPRQFDVPPSAVLQLWVSAEIMTRAKANKILQGKM